MVADNCHVTRDTAATIREVGFEVVDGQRESTWQTLPWLRPTVRGAAVKPA